MRRFEYHQPHSLNEALKLGTKPDSAFMAAGTNLLDLMKGNIVGPERLIDITRLPDLDKIEQLADGSMRIGALVKNSDLAHDNIFAKLYPGAAEALLSGASGQLRNAATVGGNIVQRTRCAYFYDIASTCNKRLPGSGCDALEGHNEGHAILGWSQACIATHPSDMCVAMTALDAGVEIRNTDRTRTVPLENFHILPGETPQRETVLEHGELITGVLLPPNAALFAAHSRYLKLRERTSYAFALVSAAAALRMEGGMITEARLSLGSVAAKPWRARAAEKLLAGAAPTTSVLERAAEIALEGASPSGHNGHKIELAKRIVVRALAEAARGTPERVPALPGSVFSTRAGAENHA